MAMPITYTEEQLEQLVERLEPVQSFLKNNHYVKQTMQKLNRLINDAQAKPMILLLGKEGVGKTATINSLLKRDLLPSSVSSPTKTNTFVKYSETEYINAVFLDGVEVTFDLNKLSLLTIADTESARTIREHIAYIEIFVQHELLKSCTLVDTVAIDSDGQGGAYFSQLLVERVDDIFWVIQAGSPLTELELQLLKKIAMDKQKPHIIVNGIDEFEGNEQRFIQKEFERYGEYVEHFLAVSAKVAIEGNRENNRQKLIDANITSLHHLIQDVTSNPLKKVNAISNRLHKWLQLFLKEMEQLPKREPYQSSIETVEQFNLDYIRGVTREERDKAIVSAYSEEFKEVSEVFKGIDTLYLLLQKIAATFYLRDEEIEHFEQLAFVYQQNVREYRKKHAEYNQQVKKTNAMYEKSFKQSLEHWTLNHSNAQITLQVEVLQQMYEELENLLSMTEFQKSLLLQNCFTIQNHLTELAQKRMSYIIKQVEQLQRKREKEYEFMKLDNDKVQELLYMVQAQMYLLDVVQPYVLKEMSGLAENVQQNFMHVFNQLQQLDVFIPIIEDDAFLSCMTTVEEPMQFIEHDSFMPLSLQETDIISILPPLPSKFWTSRNVR